MEIGTVWCERYRLQQQLGHSSSYSGRQTWLADDCQTQTPVVIKILRFDRQFRWEFLKLFEREIDTLKTLVHPALPRYIDSFDLPNDEAGMALVQSYIPAPSLQAWLQQGRTFSEAEVQQIAQALLKILIDLHCSNPPIIHRDIKLSNILLSDRSAHHVGTVYLVDFGSVQTAQATDQSFTIVGSYGYMPIELFSGRAVPASDLYSLGMSLVHLVTGIHPADLPQDLRQNSRQSSHRNSHQNSHQNSSQGFSYINGQVQFQAQLHPLFKQWIEWLIQPQVHQRPQSAALALRSLQAIPTAIQSHQSTNRWIWHDSVWQPEQSSELFQYTARPRVLQQPQGSRLVCHQDDTAIEVRFALNWSAYVAFIISLPFCLVWNSFSISMFVLLLLDSLTNLIPLLILSVFVLFGLSWLVSSVLLIIQLRRFRIDASTVKFHYHLLGIPWSQSFRRDAIARLTYRGKYYVRDSEGNRKEVSPQLSLWFGVREVAICHGLREPELEWLAQELSHWLDLPLAQIEP